MTNDPNMLEPNDPQLEALLDEALGPRDIQVPTGLADRIFVRTRASLPHPAGVLAVLHQRFPVRRVRWVAAAIVLLGWTGIWMTAGVIVRDAQALAMLDSELHQISTCVPPSAPIDQELDQLRQRIDSVQFATDTETLDNPLAGPIDQW